MIMDELPVSSGSEWRKKRERGELIQLPYSGYIVRIRTVRPDELLKLGKIPQVLTTLLLEEIYGKGEEDKYEKFLTDSETPEEAMAMLESLRVVCMAGLVEPKVVENPAADNEITIDDIDLADRAYIFRLVFAPSEALSRFRYEPPSNVDVVADGATDPQPTV
jgi:hypothetical protein